MHDQQKRRHSGKCDRREVLLRVVGQLAKETGIGDVAVRHHEKGVAIGRGLRSEIGGDGGAGTGTVIHYDLLAPAFRKLCGNGARHHVGEAAGSKPDEKTYGLARILDVLRMRHRYAGEKQNQRLKHTEAHGKLANDWWYRCSIHSPFSV